MHRFSPPGPDDPVPPWPDDTSGMIPILNTFPEPHVRWYTPERFERVFGYDPRNPERAFAERDRQARTGVKLTAGRVEAIQRVVSLWNGERVGPHDVHLLLDKIPSAQLVFDGLDRSELEPLFETTRSVDEELVTAFGEEPWFETEHTESGHFGTTYVCRCRSDYDVTPSLREIISDRDDIDPLIGDPFEGIEHRVGVGTEAVRAASRGRNVATYVPVEEYTVDLLERDGNRHVVGEVLCEHNNNQLYRETLSKINSLTLPTVLVFSSRKLIKRVLNHWEKNGYDVPGAPYGSPPHLPTLRTRMETAAAERDDWYVEEIWTISQLYDRVFTDHPPRPEDVVSLNW